MTTLREMVMKREQTPISFEQIQKVLKGHTTCNFVLMDDLPERPSDKTIFGAHDCCAILGTLHSHGHATNINHWTALIRRKGEYWFADSLGNDIATLTAKLHNGHKGLLNWANSRKVVSTRVQIQKYSSNVSDCGCHVAARLIMKHLPPRKYIHWLKHGFLGDTDLSVSLLCFFDLLNEWN